MSSLISKKMSKFKTQLGALIFSIALLELAQRTELKLILADNWGVVKNWKKETLENLNWWEFW